MTGSLTEEVLSAVSLLVAVLGVLFGVWYPELKEAQDVKVPPNLAARAPMIADVRRVWHWRAVPLLAASAMLVVLTMPIVVGEIVYSVNAFRSSQELHYNVISALFLATYLILAGLVLVLARETARLRATLSRIQQPNR